MSPLLRSLPLIVVVPQAGAAAAWERAAGTVFEASERVRHFFASPAEATRVAEPVRASVVAWVFAPPAGWDGAPVDWSNGGDEFGAARPDGPPVTCPAEMLRWLRDLTAARFADTGVSAGINQLDRDDDRYRRLAPPDLPWVRLAFSTSLYLAGPDKVSAKKTEELNGRFQSILGTWCRAEEWR